MHAFWRSTAYAVSNKLDKMSTQCCHQVFVSYSSCYLALGGAWSIASSVSVCLSVCLLASRQEAQLLQMDRATRYVDL